jgi:hypothetical protein
VAGVLVVLPSATADLAAGGPSGVSGEILGITLVAAVLHAVWNAMAHGVPDSLVGFALIGVAYTVVCGVGVLVLAAAIGGMALRPRLGADPRDLHAGLYWVTPCRCCSWAGSW